MTPFKKPNHEKCSLRLRSEGSVINSSQQPSPEDISAQLSISIRTGFRKSSPPRQPESPCALQEEHAKPCIVDMEMLATKSCWYDIMCFPVSDCDSLCLYQWSLTTKCVLHLCACLSLSGSAWPRSEVMADAVSTSWVSFTSSSSIHPHYKHKPRVSAEPWKQTRQTTS